MLKNDELVGYLKRIKISSIEVPSVEYLFLLHKAHIKYVSWQTLDIFTDKRTSICKEESIGLLLNQRSGYCFHLNHAFFWLLSSLGYQVSIHRAGVQSRNNYANIDGFHVGLIVHFQGDKKYLVDVGLGDMPYEPILLKEGTFQQNFTTYSLAKSDDNAVRLNNDCKASYLGVDYSLKKESTFNIFDTKHKFYCNSEKSPWRNLLIFKNRTDTQVNELKGCKFNSINALGIDRLEVATKKQWLDLRFYEPLIAYSEDEVDRVWLKVQSEHYQWKNR